MPARAPSAPPATPGTRLQVLDPFIAKLRSALGQPSAEGETLSLRVSGRELTVDPWTTERLSTESPADDLLGTDCCRVVLLGVALLAKCAKDLSHLEAQTAESTGSLYSARAELMLDAAIGESLVRDIQQVNDELLKRGRVEEASGLSKFHHQMRHMVYELRKQVAPEYRSTIETLAEQLSEAPPEEETNGEAHEAESTPAPDAQAAPEPPLPRPLEPSELRSPHASLDTAPDLPDAVAVLNPERASRTPSRIAVLAILLMLVALGLIAQRKSGSPTEGRAAAATLEAPTFESVIRLVEDRAPNLYITADAKAWKRLDEARQIEFLRELTTGRGTAHYSEVFVQSADGRPLTQWTVPEEPPPESRAVRARRRVSRPEAPQEN